MKPVARSLRADGQKGGSGHSPTKSAHQHIDSWRQRDYLAAALLFLGTAAFVYWQNTRVAVLWDLGYLLDTSYRISLGQIPYRDFALVHPPLTFLVQALAMRLAGRHYLLTVLYAAAAGGAGTLITWRLLLHMLRPAPFSYAVRWMIALLLAVPVVVIGIYSVYPHPIYDSDCSLAILIALLLLIRLAEPSKSVQPKRVLSLASGAMAVLPVFYKQNMGLPFLLVVAMGFTVLIVAAIRRPRSLSGPRQTEAVYGLVGMTLALLAGVLLISAIAGWGHYVQWTVHFAAQRRLPGLGLILDVYRQPSLVWTLPSLAAGLILCRTRLIARSWARAAAFCLIAAPFAGSLLFLLVQDDADERADNLLGLWPLLLAAALIALYELRGGITLARLMPIFILAAIHGTFLSQQLWGSTYALWPFLLLLVASLFATCSPPARPVVIAAASVVVMTLVICGGLYSASLERLNYIQRPDSAVQYSSSAALRGMADTGAYLRNLDELIAFTAREIPWEDPVLSLPGEDPFYFASGRAARFPAALFDFTTDPYSPAGLMAELQRQKIRWVILKRVLQLTDDPLPGSAETRRLLAERFVLFRRLEGYDVYRSK